MTDIKELIGKTLVEIIGDVGSDCLEIRTDDGDYEFYHSQECCESFYLADVDGNLQDLIGQKIEFIEEEIGGEGSGTWTFYKIGTPKDTLTLRFVGESNGYYSESCDFRKLRN